ncbi:MAG: MCE family protein [Candidatus Omnitrophica bacterium]|nr:MCE family protein [Candidatus Omnitrophota bacterium]
MKKFTNEIKIGLFVVLALCAGIFLWARTQNFSVDTYVLKTYFSYAGGIKENAVVALSGIEVGRVKEINFKYDPETKVEVVLSIKKGARVHSDSIAYIGTSGFIGDAFIGLTPGTGDYPFAKNKDVIASEDPVQSRELMKRVDNIAKNLDDTLLDVKKLAHNLNITMEGNKDNIDNIVKNLEQTAVNFNEFSEDIKRHPWKLLMKGKEKKKWRK